MVENVDYDPDDVPTDVDPTAGDCEDEAATACAYTEYEYVDAPTADQLPATGEDATGVERAVWDELYDIEDPEMPVSIVDLGLLYGVSVEDGHAEVDMTLTYSGCPARDMLLDEVEERVEAVEDIDGTHLRLVWSPEWSLEMVTDQGREDLTEFGLAV